MSNPITSFLHSLLWLTLLLPNFHLVLCDLDNILNMSIPVGALDRLPLPPNAVGPEDTAFDAFGAGPYTGVTNGRILKWSGPSTGFIDFAVTSENWSKQVCESEDVNLEPVCGRPLGLRFYNKTGTLYIADAYYNLMSVGSEGGVATLLASSAEGVPFRFPDGLDVDQDTGIVYFTDASARFQKKDEQQSYDTRDMTGRLMKYDPTTKQVTVLLRDLGFANGLAISKDGSFILVSEHINFRVQRYWLKGPKANTSEIFFNSPGGPDNIHRNANGDFWVAVTIEDQQRAIPLGILLDQINGQVLRTLIFATANVSVPTSNVDEHNGKLYMGSLKLDYIGVTRNTTGSYVEIEI